MLEGRSRRASTSAIRAVGLEIQIFRQLRLFHLTVKRTCMMDEHALHDVSSTGKKSLPVRSVLAGLDISDFQQLKIQLIHQDGGLRRVRRPLASHPASPHTAQLRVKGGHQLPGAVR
jgi:hypothetical protein